MSDADQIKVLVVLIGVLWALVMRMVWRGYDALAKKVETLLSGHALTDKDLAVVKADIASLREWRHEMANEEHVELLQELRFRRRKENGGSSNEHG